MKQLLAKKVSDGWIVTVRQVFQMNTEEEVLKFIEHHGLTISTILNSTQESYINAEG